MKNIILTIDYELFLGSKTGDVKSCMIEPTKRLMDILSRNNSKMTVFWDILHYYKLLEYSSKFPSLKNDLQLIENQIEEFVVKGHDIQLHIHPHWLDAVYDGEKWVFDYTHFDIHSLKFKVDKSDIYTIDGCISQSKSLLEDVVRRFNKDYKVQTYRAGGYLINPFVDLKQAFLRNKILIDSSVCPNMHNQTGMLNSYNFNNCPSELKYNFNDNPCKPVREGKFTEVPIKTVKIPPIINIYFTLIRKLKYKNIENTRVGKGVSSSNSNQKRLVVFKKFYNLFFKYKYVQLTTDSSFKEKFGYVLNKSENYSTMILHPKLTNEHTLRILEKYIIDKKLQFHSINKFLRKK